MSAILRGPNGPVECTLALDTGASGTQINRDILVAAGYDVTDRSDPVRMHTAGGVVRGYRIRTDLLTCLGHTATRLRVACITITATTRIDGLLGLDFLRGRVLTVDFARGRMALRPPRWWAFWR